jgi:hypothetical protein
MRQAWLLLPWVFLASPLEAQNQGPARQALVQRITQQFLENYRSQAALTPEQYQRFRIVAQRSFELRQQRQRRDQEIWRALQSQMRPGFAANPDSVSRLLDAIVSSRAGAAEQARADDKEFSTFLSPVQRAQLFLALERLQRNVERIRQRIQGATDPMDALPPEN